MKTYIYLASPYTAKKEDGSYDDVLMEERYLKVLDCYQCLLAAGLIVFCPIAMTHPVDCRLRLSPEYWYEFNKPFLQLMSMLFILKLPGWQESKGTQEEIKIAISRKIPIVYLEYIPSKNNP